MTLFLKLLETPTKSNKMSPTLGSREEQHFGQCGDRQFVVIVSEKQSRVVALPSHNCVYRQQLADTDFVVKAEIVSLKGFLLLTLYFSKPVGKKIIYFCFDSRQCLPCLLHFQRAHNCL